MKRFLSIFVCLVLLLSVNVIFASCDEDDGDAAATTTVTTTEEPDDDDNGEKKKKPKVTTTAATTVPVVPTGYKMYTDGTISFAYPGEWTMTEELEGEVAFSSETGMSNLQLSNGVPAMLWELTPEDFESMMKNSLDEEGMSVSDFVYEENTIDGLKVKEYTFETTMLEMEISMQQVMLFIKVDSTVYSLILTEYTPNPEIIDTLLSTLSKVD